jgi:hypothetical protein
MIGDLSQRFSRGSLWGLRQAPRDAVRDRQVERRWRWPVLVMLACTIPAFYAELDRKSTRLNSSHNSESRMPSSA